MEDWVFRAMARWPDVPALFGWLALDGRGRWRIAGEIISRPQIIETIQRNYGHDEHGRWYFQNGPQRGYVSLESAPLVLWVDGSGRLMTHAQQPVERVQQVYLDEHGALWMQTEHGPAVLEGNDLEWALSRLTDRENDNTIDDSQLGTALAMPSGQATTLVLCLDDRRQPVERLDRDAAPAALGFVREPRARENEKAQSASRD